MEISNNPPSGTAASTAAVPPPASAISSDFETFLKMLTAQMQNQDPLNPIQSTDYATQLATFSGVEQQVRTNDLLTALGQQLGTGGLSQLAGWVGMEARVAAPAYFDGQPTTIYPDIAATADAAILIVTDQYGQQISQQSIATDGAPIDWAGTSSSGQPLPSGLYRFTVESYANGVQIESHAAQVYAHVNEAKFTEGELVVVLKGGVEVPASLVSALRTPDA